MAIKDFQAKRIRSSVLITSGGISDSHPNLGMMIYSASAATDFEGAYAPGMLEDTTVGFGGVGHKVGDDVYLFISGSATNAGAADPTGRKHVTLFGGDMVVSGTLWAERMVVEVDEIAGGNQWVTGSLTVLSDNNTDITTQVIGAEDVHSNVVVIDSDDTSNDNALRIRADATPGNAADNDSIFQVRGDGRVGINLKAETVQTTLHVIDTTEQLRLGYNATEYVSFTVAEDYGLTISAVDAGSNSSKIVLDANNEIVLNSKTAGDGVLYIQDADEILRIFTGNGDAYYQYRNVDRDHVFLSEDDNCLIRMGTGDGVGGGSANATGRVIINAGQNDAAETAVGSDVDFQVKSDNKAYAFFVDAAADKVLILSGGFKNSLDEASGRDVGFYVSGTIGSVVSGSVGTYVAATSVFGGDLVVSGTTYLGHGRNSAHTVSGSFFSAKGADDDDHGQVQIGVVSDWVTATRNAELWISGTEETVVYVDGASTSLHLGADVYPNHAGDDRHGAKINFGGESGGITTLVGIHSASGNHGINLGSTIGTGPGAGFFIANATVGTHTIVQTKIKEDGSHYAYPFIHSASHVDDDKGMVLFLSGMLDTDGSSTAGDNLNPVDFADTNFWVSGSKGSKSDAPTERGTSVFGGDLVVSGATDLEGGLSAGSDGVLPITASMVDIGWDPDDLTADPPGYPTLRLTSYGGTLTTADTLGAIEFWGVDEGEEPGGVGAKIVAVCAEDWAASQPDYPTELQFWTAPNGLIEAQQRLVIDRLGKVGINVTDPDAGLEIFYSSNATTALKLSRTTTDYTSFTMGADGGLTIATVDAAAEAADLSLEPDGKLYLSSSVSQVLIMSSSQAAPLVSTGDPLDPVDFADTNFFVSGTIGAKGDTSTVKGTSVFGGDLVVSGGLFITGGEIIASSLAITGSMVDIGWDPGSTTEGGGPTLRLTSHDSGIDANTTLGTIEFFGVGGSGDLGVGIGAKIVGKATNLWNASDDYPTDIEFWTTPNGGYPIDRRMIIDDAGNVGIGGGSSGASLSTLHIQNSALNTMAGLNSEVNYQVTIGGSNTLAQGTGIAFTTTAATAEVGAAIAYERAAGANNQGSLILYNKNDVGSAVIPTEMVRLSHTKQVLLMSGSGNIASSGDPTAPGDPKDYTDTNFWVSGSIGAKGDTSDVKGTAVFGGDLIVSGVLHLDQYLKIDASDQDGGVDIQFLKDAGSGGNLKIKENGGTAIVEFSEGNSPSNSGQLTVNPERQNIDFFVHGEETDNLIYADASADQVNLSGNTVFSGSVIDIHSDTAQDGITSDLGAEVLDNGVFTGTGKWDRTGVFAYNTDKYTFTGVDVDDAGLLFQVLTDMIGEVGDRWYKFSYEISGVANGGGSTFTITSGFASSVVTLDASSNSGVGGRHVYFKSKSSTENFVLSAAAATAGGTFTIDNVSLKELEGGDIVTTGKVGIGILTPTVPLHVEGDVTITGGRLTLDTDGKIATAGNDDLIELRDDVVDVEGHILPRTNAAHDLGSATLRWANVYTSDLHLKNDRGDWTIVEEEDMLVVVNNMTGKRFKMMLEPLED